MRKTFLLTVLCAGALSCAPFNAQAEDKEKEEGKEEKVKIDQVPAAARKTLEAEAKGAKIDEVDKEEDDGKVIYEVDVKLDGHNYEIKVAPDGLLICKKLDEGGEEKDEKGKDEKEEKGEHEKK